MKIAIDCITRRSAQTDLRILFGTAAGSARQYTCDCHAATRPLFYMDCGQDAASCLTMCDHRRRSTGPWRSRAQSNLMAGAEPVVLFVEDDDDIREMAVGYLETAGFRVRAAADGEAALGLLAAQPPDLLITDLVMPGRIDGFELARRAIAHRPDLKILYISGYAERIRQNEGLVARGELLKKPFRLAALHEAVERQLRSQPVQLNAVLNETYTLWQSLRGSQPMPDAAHFAAAVPAPLRPNLAICEVLAGDEPQFRYAEVGALLVHAFGLDPRGTLIGAAAAPTHREFITGLYAEVARVGRPLYAASSYLSGEPGLMTERLLLPLASGETAPVSHVAVAQTFDRLGDAPGLFLLAQTAEQRASVVQRM
jgi:two-component system cell cycle response regulator CpdR